MRGNVVPKWGVGREDAAAAEGNGRIWVWEREEVGWLTRIREERTIH